MSKWEREERVGDKVSLTHCPDVHRRSVLHISHQQLWRSVPSRGHIVCVVSSWASWIERDNHSLVS